MKQGLNLAKAQSISEDLMKLVFIQSKLYKQEIAALQDSWESLAPPMPNIQVSHLLCSRIEVRLQNYWWDFILTFSRLSLDYRARWIQDQKAHQFRPLDFPKVKYLNTGIGGPGDLMNWTQQFCLIKIAANKIYSSLSKQGTARVYRFIRREISWIKSSNIYLPKYLPKRACLLYLKK